MRALETTKFNTPKLWFDDVSDGDELQGMTR